MTLPPLETTLSPSGSPGATWCSWHFTVRSEVHKLGIVACGGRSPVSSRAAWSIQQVQVTHGHTVRPCPLARPTPQSYFLSLFLREKESTVHGCYLARKKRQTSKNNRLENVFFLRKDNLEKPRTF